MRVHVLHAHYQDCSYCNFVHEMGGFGLIHIFMLSDSLNCIKDGCMHRLMQRPRVILLFKRSYRHVMYMINDGHDDVCVDIENCYS